MSSKFIYYVYCHLSMKNTFYYPYLITKWISLSNEKGNENNNMRYNHIVIRKREVIIFTLYIYIYFLPWCHPLMWIVEDEMGNFSYHVSGIGLEEATPDKAIMSSTQPPLFQKCPRTCTKYFI